MCHRLLSLAFLCLTAFLNVSGQISSLDKLDSTKPYLLKNANGYGYCIYNSAVSSYYATLGEATTIHPQGLANDLYLSPIDKSNTRNQWNITPVGDGSYYVKNIGLGEYLSNHTKIDYGWQYQEEYWHYFFFTETATPINITELSTGVFAFRLCDVQGDSYGNIDHKYMCAATQNTCAISTWTADDLGSQWQIVSVDGSDPATPDNPDTPDTPSTDGNEYDQNLGTTTYITLSNGDMYAIPQKYIVSMEDDAITKTVHLLCDTVFSFDKKFLFRVDTAYYGEKPEIESFKFNDKFNDQLYNDADGVIDSISHKIDVDVCCIGKRLTASFKVPDGASVWIDDEQQESKITRRRFDKDVTYTVAYPNHWILRMKNDSSALHFLPCGTDYRVHVNYLADNSTTQYKVPRIDILFGDSTSWNSNMWIGRYGKTYYEDASIKIDGGGVFPDLPKTEIQIKGRGNSSWSNSYSSKNPYRIKFPEKKKPLGLKKGKNWILLSNKQSGSMTTNAIAMRIADMVETKGCNHIVPVELYVNNQYRGSYNFTEKIGFSNNSIDINDESYATMLELDSYYDGTYKWKDPALSLPINVDFPDFSDPEDLAVTKLSFDDIKTAFNAFTKSVKYNDGDYEGMMDIKAFAKAWLVTDLTRNQELKHPKSWKLYNENINDSLWSFGPVWDFDWAYGYDNGGYTYFISGAQTDLFSGMSSSNTGYNLFSVLAQKSDVILKEYYRQWVLFMNDDRLNEIVEYCDDYYDFVSSSFIHNSTKWSDGKNYQTQTTNAKSWLEKRANYIFTHLKTFDLNEDIIVPNEVEQSESTTTSIDLAQEVKKINKPVNVYNMNGVCVRRNVPLIDSTIGLTPGLYIIDGEKVWVK